MRILLDENITQKSIPVLEKYGHDVIHVLHRFYAGESDEDVFRLALEEHRALITLKLELHYGLIWLRGFQVTNKTYECIMDAIGLYLKNKGESIVNTYFVVKKREGVYEMIQRFPRFSHQAASLEQ